MSEVPKKETSLEEDMDSVPLDNENRDPTPKHVPEPIPNPSAAVPKAESVVNARGVDVNVKNIPTADVEDKKLNKSSEESVTEPPVHRVQYPNVYSSDHESSNPYVQQPNVSSSANSSSFNFKETMGSVKDVLGKWGKKVGEATKKAEDLAENTWQHLKTSPSLADAALGRIAQGTKVLAEGGYEKIFRQSFETVPDEQLRNSYACYLSTSAGPVMGVLYMSTEKLAFCSDNPLSYQTGDKTEWSYYKVVIPLHQLKAINPSTSRTKPAEKYIQVISVDNHEFWFMGFLNYTSAVECLQEAVVARGTQSV